MTQALPSAVTTQMEATQKRPALIYELGLSPVVRFAAYRTNIVFPTGGDTYPAKAISLSDISRELEGQIGRITVKFDNVLGDMGAYAAAEDFKGKSLVVKRVYLDAMGSVENYKEVFNGHMETPSEIGKQLTVSATMGKPLYQKTLQHAYQRLCNTKFGDSRCGVDLSGLTDTKTDITPVYGTYSEFAITYAQGAGTGPGTWKNGKITITIDGTDYTRKVKDYAYEVYEGADVFIFRLNVNLPVQISGTISYSVEGGCDYTWATCKNENAWGPDFDNRDNFRGFFHISNSD